MSVARTAEELFLKILLGTSVYAPNAVGGAEKVVQSLATSFAQLGHEIIVITTQPRGAATYAKLDGVSVYYIPVKNIFRPYGDSKPGAMAKSIWRVVDSFNALMMPSLTRILKKEKPDVVNTHNITGLSVSLWSSVHHLNIPIVHTLHDQYLLCHRGTMFKNGENCSTQCLDCRLLTVPRKAVSKHIAAVIGVSEFILRRHQALGYFNSCPSTVIYNSGNRLAPAERRRSPAEPLRFGFLGQIIPTKGLRELIYALRFNPVTMARLYIGGKCDTPYAESLRAETKNQDDIHWLGYVKPADFFPAIDILVVPSTWNDTAPLVILEAFSHGVPVLGSDRGGIPELITPHTGWLFEPSKPGALSKALLECLQAREKITSMSVACLERARQSERSPWAENYLAVYTSAISKNSQDSAPPAGSA